MRNKVIKTCCFLFILVLLLCGFQNIFSFKYVDGIYQWDVFYEEEENSIDMLCMGSSHVFENVNTGVLWDEYGIASFDLCGSRQPLWNTYYYLKEALKTQTPKLIVVDVYSALQQEEYSDESRIIKNNYGLKPSRDKIESVMVSSPEEKWLDYMLEYPTWHSRYSEIDSSDFLEDLGRSTMQCWKGYALNADTAPMTRPEGIEYITAAGEMTDKAEEYMRKIIELAKKTDIPLLFIETPYIVSAEDQMILNRAEEIAGENGVPFVNFNLFYDAMGLDFQTDFADADHLNHRGNVKFTNYLGQYIKNNYDIPDRRGDEKYASYEQMAEECSRHIYNQEVKETGNIYDYFQKLQDEEYTVICRVSGDSKNVENYEDVRNVLLTYGISLDKISADTVWVMQGNEILFQSQEGEGAVWHEEKGVNDVLTVTISEENDVKTEFNHEEYEAVSSGIDLLVYDNLTGSLVESAGFPVNGNILQPYKVSGGNE